MISTQSRKYIQNLLIVEIKASSPSGENVDLRKIASEMGVEIKILSTLGQSVLPRVEGRANEEVVWRLSKSHPL